MKRSYGQTSSGPQQPQPPPQQASAQPYAFSAPPSGPQPTAPLPPGPPPPPPASAPNPYAAYGYGGQQQVQQPPAVNPYPAYGYGGQANQAYTGYPAQNFNASGSPTYPQYPGQQQPPSAAGVPANPYGAYGTPQAYAAAVAAAGGGSQQQQPQQQQQQYYPQSQQPQQQYGMQYGQPSLPQGFAPPPPPSQLPPPPPLPQQFNAGVGGGGAPGMPSPQGAPPFKRTRYDQQPGPPVGGAMPMQNQPPPALPPLGSAGRGRGGGPPGGFQQGRGGGGMGMGMGRGGSPADFGPPLPQGQPPYSGGPGGPQFGMGRPSGPGGGRGGAPTGGGGFGSRGGREGPPYGGGGGRPGAMSPPSFSRGGPPPNAPFGPLPTAPTSNSGSTSSRGAAPRRGGSTSSGFDRGRPVSGLPSTARGGPTYGSSGGRLDNVPKGPRASRAAFGSSPAPARKERKWGAGGSGKEHVREEPKGQLTDFRIAGLRIPEIDWEWKAEPAKPVVVEEEKPVEEPKAPPNGKSHERDNVEVKEEPKEGDEEDDEKTDAVVEEQRLSSPVADMSVDTVAPEDLSTAAAVEEDSESTGAAKKKTKKQKKAEAAAKRSATLAASKANGAAVAPVPASPPATDDGAQSTSVSTIPSESTTKNKTLAKHGRDDDEEESLVVTDVSAAKKVKADNGEVVKLENVDVGLAGPPSAPVVETEPTPAPVRPKPDLSLPEKPIAALDHARDHGRSSQVPVPPAPANRENSRLRIYFSSPLSFSTAHSSRERDAGKKVKSVKDAAPSFKEATPSVKEATPSVKESTPARETSSTPIDADVEALPVVDEEAPVVVASPLVADEAVLSKAEAISAPALGDEDLDGEAVDVDGEAVVSAALQSDDGPRHSSSETDDDDEDEVQSSLLATKPTEPSSSDLPTSEPPLLPSDASAYPPIPYPPEHAPAPSTVDVDSASQAPLGDAVFSSPDPSPDRISLSYARNTRRLVIDADVVETVTIFRADGRIEVSVALQPALVGEGENATVDTLRVCSGVLVEALDLEVDDYVPISRATLEESGKSGESAGDAEVETVVDDPFLPPLHKFLASVVPLLEGQGVTVTPGFNHSHVTFVAYLDRSNPLTEARWVKTGEVDTWIASFSPSPSQDTKKPVAQSKWKGKITVSDPDPPPTIQHALDTWATSSNTGSLADRTSFVANHMSNIDNVFEILLRLTRGDRAGPSHSSASTQPSAVGALAASLSAPYAEHQTQVSLAVLAMFRLSVETAAKAGIPQQEVEKQVGEIVRGIPYHLIFKSLDGMFREQQRAKRG